MTKALTQAHLRTLSFHLGLPLTGTKPVLTSNILTRLTPPSSPKPPDRTGDSYRILSIDLGIRNLAYTLLTVPSTTLSDHARSHSPDLTSIDFTLKKLEDAHGAFAKLSKVERWERLALSNASGDTEAVKETFDPLTLAYRAHNLCTSQLLPLKPTHIVLERQRHRSGGASAVLEWTFRVNMLESMLYAIFTTKAREQEEHSWRCPEPQPIDPKRMNAYWTESSFASRILSGFSSLAGQEGKKVPKGRKEKADRIAVARDLVENGLTFDSRAEMAKNSLLGREKTQLGGKTDDLADCLLQGLAFVEWEGNQRLLSSNNALIDQLKDASV